MTSWAGGGDSVTSWGECKPFCGVILSHTVVDVVSVTSSSAVEAATAAAAALPYTYSALPVTGCTLLVDS